MSSGPRHGRLVAQLQFALREATSELTHLNHAVSGRVGLALGDLEAFDLLARRGPLTPSELATLSGLSPATVTGLLDRLETNGWVRRVRDPNDRRRVNLEVAGGRIPALAGQYRGMQGRLAQICADYSDDQLDLIIDFIHQLGAAGTQETAQLRAEPKA